MNVLVSSLGSGCYKNDLAKDTCHLQKVQSFPNKKKRKAQAGSAAGLPNVRAKECVSKEGENREKEETWAREIHYLRVIKSKANHNKTTRNPH